MASYGELLMAMMANKAGKGGTPGPVMPATGPAVGIPSPVAGMKPPMSTLGGPGGFAATQGPSVAAMPNQAAYSAPPFSGLMPNQAAYSPFGGQMGAMQGRYPQLFQALQRPRNRADRPWGRFA